MSLKSWVRRRRDTLGVRAGLHLAQAAYGTLERALDRESRPAIHGGRAVRCVPLPAPRPIARHERRELNRVARGQSTSFFDGTTVSEFERKLARRWDCKYVFATSSGTAALHTALMAAGIGEGDEVIVPVLTYVATAMAVRQAGARPRFVDADAATWNIDVKLIEDALSPNTRAILPVHIGGVACDMRAIRAIADRHGLLVIEDAAHAHGSLYEGRFCGTLGDMGCFSFGSPKSLTTGEGGALFTNDPELARRARMAMNLGEVTAEGLPSMGLDFFSPETRLDYPMIGWNYRMSVAQAALGLGQLARFDSIARRRRSNGRYLLEELDKLTGVHPQQVTAGADPCYYCFPMRLTQEARIARGALLEGLAAERIDFRLLSNLPLNEHEVFDHPGEFPVAAEISRNAVALRTDPALGRREMRDMLRAIRRLLEWGPCSSLVPGFPKD